MVFKQGENVHSVPAEAEQSGTIYFVAYADDFTSHGFDVSSPINVFEVLMSTETGEVVVWHM